MKPTISKPFKSNDRTFDKVYNAFDKRDYFNSQGLAKTQIGNFERALQKNDKGAQQVLDLFKGDEKKAKDYITQVVSDRNKQKAFNNYKALKSAVDSIQKGKPNVGAVDYVKRIIHNSSQKYSIALYSTLRNKKFTKWKDVHNDIDSLIGESVNEVSDSEIKKIIKKKEKGGPYTVVVQKGNMSKHISHAKDVGDSVDKAIKVYHQFKKKHRNGVQIIDGYGRTVFFESVNEVGAIKNLMKIMQNKYDRKGYSLKQLHDEVINYLGKKDGGLVFYEFIKRNKNNKKVQDEFKKTSFNESVNEEVPQGYNPVVEDKKQIKDLVKKVKHEKLFYDVLDTMEKKYGKNKYRIWLEKSLKDFGVNPKHYDYRTNAAAEEKLFQLGK
jgi:superfamily II DNA helicase RecQ